MGILCASCESQPNELNTVQERSLARRGPDTFATAGPFIVAPHTQARSSKTKPARPREQNFSVKPWGALDRSRCRTHVFQQTGLG